MTATAEGRQHLSRFLRILGERSRAGSHLALVAVEAYLYLQRNPTAPDAEQRFAAAFEAWFIVEWMRVR